MMASENSVLEDASCDGAIQSFGDTLHGVLVRTIEKNSGPGLLALQFPTGLGKSYAVERTIATLVASMPDDSPPVLFVTSQKKNIPSVEKIVRLCQEEGYTPGQHDIMRLLSITEMVSRTAYDGLLHDVPKAHMTKGVERFIEAVLDFRGCKGYETVVRGMVSDFKKSVRKLLPPGNWKERLDIIERCDEWQWLARFWPFVFTRKAKALFMTSKKFFCPHDTLIEASCSIDKAPWTYGSIVFMDEFDSIKTDCLDTMVSNAVKNHADLPGLVRSLWRGVDVSTLPEAMLAGEGGERNRSRIMRLEGVLADAARETHVDYVYKTDESVTRTSSLFMYDGVRRGTNVMTSYVVHTDDSRRENVISKKTEKKRGRNDKSGRDDGFRRLDSDVNRLRGAVAYTQNVIMSMLRSRYGRGLIGMGEGAMRNEVFSILEAWGVNGFDEKQLIFEGVRELVWRRSAQEDSMQGERTLYEQGFGLIAIEDSDEHRFSTHICAYAMDETPEKRLYDFVKNAFVVGISATALIDSPLCNYDLEWLQSRDSELMHSLDDEDVEMLREAFERHIDGYDNVDIRVVPIGIFGGTRDTAVYHEENRLVSRATLYDKATNILSDRGLPKYIVFLYVRVAKAYRYFLEHISDGVFICATTRGPRQEWDGSAGYDIAPLKALLRLIRQDMGVTDDERSVRFIEGSDGFQEKYDAMVGELGASRPRMFICSAYGSLAMGVNLQYDGKGMQTVSVSDLSFDSRVDLVGVYLDAITNVAPSYKRIDKRTVSEETRAKNVLRCAYELREMAWHGDISLSQADSATNSLIGEHLYKTLVTMPSVRAACTRTAVQMVGRMCRTSNKAPCIHVLFDSGFSGRIDPWAMGDDLMGVETRALLDKVASGSAQKPDAGGRMERIIASRAVTTAGWLGKYARRGIWKTDEMRFWENMRSWCLEHPCPVADELVGSGMDYFYVPVDRPVGSYRYALTGDFVNVDVSFDMANVNEYPYEVSDCAARLDVLARVPEVRDLFERKGWPLAWTASDIVMNPAFFQSVYVGAVGEQAGKAIIEAHVRGLALDSIEDSGKFEKFDFVVSGTDVYVDFKHWRSPDMSGGRYVEHIREKMRKVGAMGALIVNLVSTDRLRDKKCEEMPGGVFSVPYLVDDEAACVSSENLDCVRRWLRKVGVL